MTPRFINLRGTHGSGKSTVVRRILEAFPSTEIPDPLSKRGRPLAYSVQLPRKKRLGVAGPYSTPCGGCDALQPYSRIWPLVLELRETHDYVLFEGALVSSSYGEIGRASEEFGAAFIFAFLDTPLAECLRRIAARRAARGVTEPLNPHNTEAKFHSVARSREKILQLGRRVVDVDHRNATAEVLALLGVRS